MTLGAAALAIANGATGAVNKITVALDFITRTGAAGLGEAQPLPIAFLTTAAGVLSGVDGTALNDASVTAGENATTVYISNASGSQASATIMNGNATSPSNGPLTIPTSDTEIDPGIGNCDIQFLPGTSGDTLATFGWSRSRVRFQSRLRHTGFQRSARYTDSQLR